MFTFIFVLEKGINRNKLFSRYLKVSVVLRISLFSINSVFPQKNCFRVIKSKKLFLMPLCSSAVIKLTCNIYKRLHLIIIIMCFSNFSLILGIIIQNPTISNSIVSMFWISNLTDQYKKYLNIWSTIAVFNFLISIQLEPPLCNVTY